MAEAVFWTTFGPLLTEKMNEVKVLQEKVKYWKDAYSKLLRSLEEPDPEPEPEPDPEPDPEPEPKPLAKPKSKRDASPKRKIKTLIPGNCLVDGCGAKASPYWRPNIGKPEWGERICNTCWCRLRKSKPK